MSKSNKQDTWFRGLETRQERLVICNYITNEVDIIHLNKEDVKKLEQIEDAEDFITLLGYDPCNLSWFITDKINEKFIVSDNDE